jgi:hypothetical protein
VYDVQSIPTIGSGGSAQLNRGGVAGRSRPFLSSMSIEKMNTNFFYIFFLFQFQQLVEHGQHVVALVEEL